ncbi:uncharacterized protein IUM83_13305 [Phytophthora cinnamomi]|uniref:uncharacterized protein n=1 Tax=Phytophthora cinnamomi TaxID=4785 RepID=UPI00355A564C|nr:hypothetical protein IUM83_13305 [Phytophthora cinnamomi]
MATQLVLRSQSLHASLVPVSLSARLDAVDKTCASGTASTASRAASQYLIYLNEVKCRLQRCSQALVEAARWGLNVRACFAAVEDLAMLSQALKGDGDADGLVDQMHLGPQADH